MTFEQIYKQFYKELFFSIKKIVKNEMDAEELANEAMIRVHKNLNSFDETKSSLRTWIINIGKNAAIDFWRKKKLATVSLDQFRNEHENGEHGDIDYFIGVKDTDNNPEEEMIETEVRKLMYDLFSELSDSDQLAASLHYFDGLSYEEVSNEMNMPLGTVKAKIHKARVKLMNAFPSEMRKLSLIEK